MQHSPHTLQSSMTTCSKPTAVSEQALTKRSRSVLPEPEDKRESSRHAKSSSCPPHHGTAAAMLPPSLISNGLTAVVSFNECCSRVYCAFAHERCSERFSPAERSIPRNLLAAMFAKLP